MVLNSVVGKVQSQLGTAQFSQEEFITQLKDSGLAGVLEQQFGIRLEDMEFTSPSDLAESLRVPLAKQLAEDLEGFVEGFLGPYLPFIPLIAAFGVAASLLFVNPVFSWASVGFFALVYRGLILTRFARFETETREVSAFKTD